MNGVDRLRHAIKVTDQMGNCGYFSLTHRGVPQINQMIVNAYRFQDYPFASCVAAQLQDAFGSDLTVSIINEFVVAKPQFEGVWS